MRQTSGKIVGIGFSSSLPDPRHDRVAMNLLRVASFHFYCAYAELKGDVPPAAPHLSDREREVLQWIACGKSKSEIAAILDVSEAAIKRYCESSFRKLDANTLAFAVAKAIQWGLIFPDF
jgi:DNA-binding CsgD family transcriptional regulator